MIYKFINRLFRGSSKVERLPVKETAVGSSPTPGAIPGSSNGRTRDFESCDAGSNPAPGTINRRKFFSFMGAGVAMLAKPDLFLGPVKKIVPVHLGWTGSEWGWWTATGQGWAQLEERVFFEILKGEDHKLLPSIPNAPDGQAIYGRWEPLP